MNRIQSETTAAPRFEGTLPRNFFDPKPKQEPKPSIDWRIPLWANVAVTVLLAAIVITHKEAPLRPAPEAPSRSATVTTVPAPVTITEPVMVPTPVPAPEPLVLRAQPVEPTVRRGLPVEGQLYLATMPDGRTLLVRFMGAVRDFDGLPKNPNLYDLYQVKGSGHSWVFMQPAGFSAPAWVDP